MSLFKDCILLDTATFRLVGPCPTRGSTVPHVAYGALPHMRQYVSSWGASGSGARTELRLGSSLGSTLHMLVQAAFFSGVSV